jgi:hypothetical protein
VGPPVPAAAALGRELRQTLPPALVEALDRISDQIKAEILEPLLCAPSVDQVAMTFEKVFPKFRDYYVSTVLIMWGFFQEDPHRLSALAVRGFEESEDLIRQEGAHWIGPDAALNALHGLATIVRVAKVATKLFDRKQPTAIRVDESEVEQWANSIIAHAMAFSAVLAALTALANGQPTVARLDNVAALAHWSKAYAVRSYHLAKTLGLLNVRPPAGPVGVSEEEEDLLLAEAGLESYTEGLAQDDHHETSQSW